MNTLPVQLRRVQMADPVAEATYIASGLQGRQGGCGCSGLGEAGAANSMNGTTVTYCLMAFAAGFIASKLIGS